MSKSKKHKQKNSYDDLFERYKIIVAARNFHYNNFNKWLTYFYVANAAIFVAYSQTKLIETPILILGTISALLLYWTSKGYYYWNINFIMLVSHYEVNLLKWGKKERVYSMFANKERQNNFIKPYSGANFSTSKIAIFFAFIIVVSWLTTLINKILSYCHCLQTNASDTIIKNLVFIGFSSLFIIGITAIVGGVKKHFLHSNIDSLHDLEMN